MWQIKGLLPGMTRADEVSRSGVTLLLARGLSVPQHITPESTYGCILVRTARSCRAE
ncbi:hypothetical protein CHELA1G11_14363 [Hyphomicrobiales bacterium]|nr:hypothetical protein CHELA1G11_14363 [Hyphomicrobiales bacterium]CAH1680671.1 hypothetical protein CHELA1G2_14742 [Hyphomicrobiales bacterium]